MSLIRASLYEAAVINGTAYVLSSFRQLINNEIINISVVAPTSPPETIALSLEVDPSGQLLVEAFRAATLNATPGGTILTLFNANEASLNVATTVVRENPVIDDDGDLIAIALVGSSNKGNTASTGRKIDVVTLLKESGATLIRLTSGSSSNIVNFFLGIVED